MGTTAQISDGRTLPAGVLVTARPEEISRSFGALCALQPLQITPDGLVCAPRAAPDLAGPALRRCPLPVRELSRPPGWPTPPAALLAGWYRRGPEHLPAPPGVRELIQAPGEGFGPGDHATTEMCLRAIERLPAGPALDAGCGSGLLAQAWARLGRGPVLACDVDGRALVQAAASMAAAGLDAMVDLRRCPIEALAPGDVNDRVVLANVPLPAHMALLHAAGSDTPRGVVLSGLRPTEGPDVVAAWQRRGLRVVAASRRGRFCCWVLAVR